MCASLSPISTFKKKKRRLGSNGPTFSQSPRKRGKNHHHRHRHHILRTPILYEIIQRTRSTVTFHADLVVVADTAAGVTVEADEASGQLARHSVLVPVVRQLAVDTAASDGAGLGAEAGQQRLWSGRQWKARRGGRLSDDSS